jgi:hypothetical protein
MSYDMAFWYEEGPIAASVASSKYDRMVPGATGVAAHNQRLDDFYHAMIERYPNLTMENMDVSPWTAPVDYTSEWVQVNISWPRSRTGVVADLLELARRYEITSYDPQSGIVYAPSDILLKLSNGKIFPNPDRRDVEQAIRSISRDKLFVILDFTSQRFVQAAHGPSVGASNHNYVIEFRDGDERTHRMTAVDDVRQVIFAFSESLQGGTEWREDFIWLPVA